MGIFGSSDEEKSRERKNELDRREAELEEKLATLKKKEAEIAAREVELERRITSSEERQTQRRAAFDKSWQEAEARIAGQEQLLNRRHDEYLSTWTERERALAALAEKIAVTERAAVDAHNRRVQALSESHSKWTTTFQQEADSAARTQAKKEEELARREVRLRQRELEVGSGLAEEMKATLALVDQERQSLSQKEDAVERREQALSAEKLKLGQDSEELRIREKAVRESEQLRDQGFSEEKRRFDDEMHALRKALDADLADTRSRRMAAADLEVAEYKAERLSIIDREVQEDAKRMREHVAKTRQSFEIEMKKGQDDLAMRLAQLEETEHRISEGNSGLLVRERLVEARERAVAAREDQVAQEVEQQLAARQRSYDKNVASLEQECERLRESLGAEDAKRSEWELLKRRLGDEPEAVLRRLNNLNDENAELRRKQLQPDSQLQERVESLQEENAALEARWKGVTDENAKIRTRQLDVNKLELDLGEERAVRSQLETMVSNFEARCNQLAEQLERSNAAYAKGQDREKRIENIKTVVVERAKSRRDTSELTEVAWLEDIANRCRDHGLRFPRRILWAFHTALKTSEWSPITILAGVSGTGKSKLPELYSLYGGIHFLSVSVQPNWDSKESMLGFFNSIDNAFDAEEVLRFLAQSQSEESDDYPGLLNSMCMVLLDEMNLAHPELYFAEFLSKLELRRGRGATKTPTISLKLGSHEPPYKLQLGRNVLWTGTMNQDETTKTLSDKVLDRSTVIHFPRPASLERRTKLRPLGEMAAALPRDTWFDWSKRTVDFGEPTIMEFKAVVERINKLLGKVGRSIGHRVWQSVEFYMANYPDVIRAREANDGVALKKWMRIAFEDQLVQKIMPKLRGIETRGHSKTACLDEIQRELSGSGYERILDDFGMAMNLGHGQFLWQSANYLADDVENPDFETPTVSEPERLSETEGANAETKKAEPKKSEPTKADSKKAEPKKPESKKPEPKKPEPKKVGPQSSKPKTKSSSAGSASSGPPPEFKPDAPDREASWKKLTPKQRRMFGG